MGKEDMIAMEEKIEKGRQKVMKEKKEKLKKKKIGFFADFKAFITKGNVLDLAVALVMGSSFNAIVSGLVKYIITPFITICTSGVSIDEWEYVLREEVLNAEGVVEVTKVSIQYGLWLQTIVDFLIIAFSIFVAVRIIRTTERKLRAKEIAAEEEKAAKKKAADEAAAAVAKEAEEAKKATEAEFYANVREQSELLREIRDSLNRK